MAPVALDTPRGASEVQRTPSGKAAQLDLSQRHDYILDYRLWSGPSSTSSTRAAFLTSLRGAIVGIDFFYLSHSPLDEASTDLFDLSERFFALPFETRQRIDIDNSRHYRGYSKFGDERTLQRVDHRDQIDYATESTPLDPVEIHQAASASSQKSTDVGADFLHLRGPNQYLPESVLPRHRELVENWQERCRELTIHLTIAMEQALGIPDGSFTSFITSDNLPPSSPSATAAQPPALLDFSSQVTGVKPRAMLEYARMKMIRYPVGDVVDGVQREASDGKTDYSSGVSAHRDGGWLTLLATSSVGGLQVQDLSGEWISVPHRPGSIVVNFGQQLEVVSRGLIRAATHRVITPHTQQQDRLSIAYFAMPGLNVVMRPLPDDVHVDQRVVDAHQKAVSERGEKGVVSDVKEKDLHAPDEPFGVIAWRGIYRSHPGVVQRWHRDAKT